jgi:hypothetical protein
VRPLVFLLLAAFAASLGGCAAFNQPFSCAPDVGPQRIDVDQYRSPSTTAGTGYPHC